MTHSNATSKSPASKWRYFKVLSHRFTKITTTTSPPQSLNWYARTSS